MADRAFVLIETAVGKIKEVVSALEKIEGLRSVDAVTGPYDIIAVVEGENLNAVGRLVTEKVHPVSGINRTITCLAIRVS